MTQPLTQKTVRAWLLDWAPQMLALAACEVIEIVHEPEIHRVPFGPPWCRALLYWRNRLLPLALPDLAADAATMHVVVVAYENADRAALDYAALAVDSHPRQIQVPDGTDCEPPTSCLFDHSVLRACFTHEDRVILVPELKEWFGANQQALVSTLPD